MDSKLVNRVCSGVLPQHVAIIMDGNGRWAEKKGVKRLSGHQNAITAVRDVIEGCAELGMNYLTLYTFSTENWERPRAEVEGLMTLLVSTIENELPSLIKNNIRLSSIGDNNTLPHDARRSLKQATERTCGHSGMELILAINYSGRWDIINAVNNLLAKRIDKVNATKFARYLSTSKIPDPELLIRTSGEMRISNFLLWQLAYTELYFTDVFWPDFRKEHLYHAIVSYQKRERRFGKTGKQLKVKACEN